MNFWWNNWHLHNWHCRKPRLLPRNKNAILSYGLFISDGLLYPPFSLITASGGKFWFLRFFFQSKYFFLQVDLEYFIKIFFRCVEILDNLRKYIFFHLHIRSKHPFAQCLLILLKNFLNLCAHVIYLSLPCSKKIWKKVILGNPQTILVLLWQS